MLTLHIYSLGKHNSSWLKVVIDMYTRRLQSFCHIQWHLYKKESTFYKSISHLPSWIYLTEKGPCTDSMSFANKFRAWRDSSGGHLHFVIGGDQGLIKPVADKATTLLSLSPMTLTHQMVRSLFLEQIYRATQIMQNSPYHK